MAQFQSTSAHKEQFSIAYVRAVAAAAGYSVYVPSVDDDSVDIGIASRLTSLVKSPRLELQVKCSGLPTMSNDIICYELKRKNYDDLRCVNLLVPRILVLLLVPDVTSEWFNHTEECFSLRRCAYWVSLLGHAPITNKRSVTIHLPRSQMFGPQTLAALLRVVANGSRP